jgi:hypothetical protein
LTSEPIVDVYYLALFEVLSKLEWCRRFSHLKGTLTYCILTLNLKTTGPRINLTRAQENSRSKKETSNPTSTSTRTFQGMRVFLDGFNHYHGSFINCLEN